MTQERETSFLLRRAEEEAVLAVQADQTPAGEAHRELAVRYSARARDVLAEDDGEASIHVPGVRLRA